MADSVIAASPETLQQGGGDLQETADLAVEIYEKLKDACVHFAYAGGTSDQLAKQFYKTYKPAEKGGLEFLQMLAVLLTGDGADVNAAGQLLNSADVGATTAAGGGGRRG